MTLIPFYVAKTMFRFIKKIKQEKLAFGSPKAMIVVCFVLFCGIPFLTFNVPALAVPGLAPSVDATTVGIARGVVEQVGGLHEIAWDEDGTIEQILVVDGDSVKKGAPLIILDRQAQALEKDIAHADLVLARAQRDALVRRVPFNKASVQRLRAAVKTGGIEVQRLRDAENELDQLQGAVNTASANVVRATKALSGAQWAFERRVLRAAADSRVLHITAKVGAAARSQSALVTLLPEGERMVRVEISPYFADSIRVGMTAKVERDMPAATAIADGKTEYVSSAFSSSRYGDGSALAAPRVLEAIVSLPLGTEIRVGELVRVRFYE